MFSNYEFNLIKIAIAKNISNKPTTIKAMFKILENVDELELDETLLTFVEFWEFTEDKVSVSVEESSTIEFEVVVVVFAEFDVWLDELPTELFTILFVLFAVLVSVLFEFIDMVLSKLDVFDDWVVLVDNWFSSIA